MDTLESKVDAPQNSHPGSGKGEASASHKSSRKSVDWEAIEKDWRAGIKTKLEISEKFGVSRAAMDKHFRKLGIDRDLAAKIRAKADALVTQAAVTQAVTENRLVTTEKEIVEANATLQAQIRREQRADIQRSRTLVMKLLAELETQTENVDLFRQLGEIMSKPDEKGNLDKMAEVYAKVTSLSGRTGNMKSLAESLRVLVALEREAFGIDDRPKPPAPKETSTDLSLLDDSELMQYEQLVRKAQVPM